MSRIGKRAVAIPRGVTANIDGKTLSVKGPKGTLDMGLSDLIEYTLEDGESSGSVDCVITKSARMVSQPMVSQIDILKISSFIVPYFLLFYCFQT